MKYLCMAYEREDIFQTMSGDDWESLRTETLDYVSALQQSGHLILTYALQSRRKATTVRVRGGKLATTDGPFAETKEQIGGFFLIEACDLDEAVRIAANWPSARLGSIEVRPIEEVLPLDTRYR